jgi:riboflavin synthase
MFTGIVSSVGTVLGVAEHDRVRRLSISTHERVPLPAIGASVAIAGVCLTVVDAAGKPGDALLQVDAAPETLAVTTAGDWQAGTRLNLERSLKMGDELGGHMVSGHIDGVARIVARKDMGESVQFSLEAPAALARFIAAKGSVALDGTSLTVNHVAANRFDCLMIPHTLAVTTWGEKAAGDRVNLEVDILARYVARLAEAR